MEIALYIMVILFFAGLNLLIRLFACFNIHINVFDMLAVGGSCGLYCYFKLGWHMVFSLLAAAAAAQLLHMLFINRIGFWIVTISFSALWLYLTTAIVMEVFSLKGDLIWFWALLICGFLYNCFLHYSTYERSFGGEDELMSIRVRLVGNDPPVLDEMQRAETERRTQPNRGTQYRNER